jgi:cellulose synthase/poly-beta-1,6-N-acetylglucosamine synthase-like glycosyltransferase
MCALLLSSFIVSVNAQETLIQQEAPSTAVVLAMDTSDSMWGNPMTGAREAAAHFVRRVDESFPVAITSFSSRVTLMQELSTDKSALQSAIDNLSLGGVTALYDGSVYAIETAAAAGVAEPIVILLSDGAEYGGLSEATRETALELASNEGVTVYTVGLGFGIDRSYLSELATRTGGEFYEVEDGASLTSTFDTIYETINARVPAADTASAAPTSIAPVTETDAQTLAESTLTQPVIEPVAPLADELAALFDAPAATNDADDVSILPLTGNSDRTESNTGSDSTAPYRTVVSPGSLEAPAPEPQAENVYIQVTTPVTYPEATLSLNDTRLKTFFEEPYDYTLDADLLQNGTYRLGFSVLTENDLTISDDITFDIRITEGADNQKLATLLVDGNERTLDLAFSLNDGLTYSVAAETAATDDNRNLSDILMQPLSYIPEPVKEALTQQHTELVIALVVIMTVILLPQGIFTIYWMTYTWVHPQRFEKSGAPKQYEVPRYSFTALLPARKEEAVIYDTIMSVNNIDYPEHLKETLILVRDEDDDGTIERTMAAIADIKKEYEKRGEEYPDNVHLITFTEGPKNKPNGLNRGYRETTKEVICIFDAEDQPHEQIYNAVNTKMMNDGADVVQSGVQLMNFRTNWFSSFNVLEYFFWFKSGLHAYTEGMNVTPLGGNTVFFKKEWLDILAEEDEEEGYRVWNEARLTEDADIGLRLTGMGAKIQIMYDAELATREETPGSISEFIKQRTRWCQGFYEIFMDGYWLDLPTLKQRIASIYILLNSILQAGILLFLPVGIYIGFFQQVPVAVALLSWLPVFLLITQLIIALIGIREFTELYGKKLPLFFRWRMVLFYYPYQLLLAVAAVRAIYRFMTNQSAWEKTSHSNLHRQNQAASVQQRAA